jgi:hypothetical protein
LVISSFLPVAVVDGVNGVGLGWLHDGLQPRQRWERVLDLVHSELVPTLEVTDRLTK